MWIVVSLEIDEAPETIQDLAKAKSWRIHGREKIPPTVLVNPTQHFDSGYGDSSVPERK